MLKTYRTTSGNGTVLPGGVLGRYASSTQPGTPAIWRSDTGQGNTPQAPSPFAAGAAVFVGRFGPGLDLYRDPNSGAMYFYNVQQQSIFDGQGRVVMQGGAAVDPYGAQPPIPTPPQAPPPSQTPPPQQTGTPAQTPPPSARGAVTPIVESGDPAAQYGLPSPWGTVGGPSAWQHPRANSPASAQDVIDAWQLYTGAIPSGSTDITAWIGKPLVEVVKAIAAKGVRGTTTPTVETPPPVSTTPPAGPTPPIPPYDPTAPGGSWQAPPAAPPAEQPPASSAPADASAPPTDTTTPAAPPIYQSPGPDQWVATPAPPPIPYVQPLPPSPWQLIEPAPSAAPQNWSGTGVPVENIPAPPISEPNDVAPVDTGGTSTSAPPPPEPINSSNAQLSI